MAVRLDRCQSQGALASSPLSTLGEPDGFLVGTKDGATLGKRNQLPYFPFYAGDYLDDPAVVQMGADTEGCFIRCLARSWQTSTPGIIADPLIYDFCGMYRIEDQYRILFGETYNTDETFDLDAMTKDRVKQVEVELARAFDTTSRPGFWVQKRMVSEHHKLTTRLEARQAGAAKTNEIKEASRSTNGDRNGHRPVTARRPPEEVDLDLDLDLDSQESTSKHSSLRSSGVLSPRKKSKAESDPEDQSWVQLFDWFWVEYPKKVGKPAALRAWKAIRPQTQATVEAIGAGLEAWRPQWTDPQFIPHPSTWLNQHRWEDQP